MEVKNKIHNIQSQVRNLSTPKIKNEKDNYAKSLISMLCQKQKSNKPNIPRWS